MNIYIDKPNLLSVIHSVKNDRYSDCIKMLKNCFSIYFTFSKDDVKKLPNADKVDIMQWLTQMSTGVGNTEEENVKWESRFPMHPLEVSTWNSEKLSSVYCLSKENDIKLESTMKKGNLIIACEGEEIETLSSLFFENYQFTKDIFHKITSWNDLESYISPCTDIIISDPYIFSSPELYQQNILSLFRVLGSKIKNSQINIVIFTLRKNYDQSSRTEFEPDWDTIYSKIRKCSEKHSKFNVTFVTAGKDTLEEHDRTIFTNYKLFSSGDTYNYFNSSGKKITKGRWLHVHSLADKDNEATSKIFIKDMQTIIDTISQKNNETLIKKDKISNFLNFSQ